ncbi:MAG TPA: ergothioneine biosynthesis protein EgtB [Burkholderiaceae bacterium]
MRTRFDAVRAQSLALIDGLSAEDCALQSMPDTSPVRWHLAHTTWFFEVFALERFEPGFQSFHPAFRMLFNSYYNGVGDKHLRAERGLVSRPGLTEVLAYRENVEARLRTLLQAPPGGEGDRAAFAEVIELGLNHEQQHQELLLTDLKHLFSRNPLLPAYRQGWPSVPVNRSPSGWLACPGGLVDAGTSAGSFAFDNERPQHRVYLEPFELALRPVSCGEVIAFIEDGGYRRAELWLSAGWDTVQQHGWEAPLYWQSHSGGARSSSSKGRHWETFTLRGVVDISPEAPAVHLSHYEADAIARWLGARLPTEFEWEHVARQVAVEGNLLESRLFHPAVALATPRPGQPTQMFGDVWEWTQSAYLPYPGYRPAAGAIGEYNGKFMSQQMVLRGGSCATPRSHLRATYRNFFPPQARWQFSGARLARDLR